MTKDGRPQDLLASIGAHYSLGLEEGRLFRDGEPGLELTRTLEILDRVLPAPPSRVLDVGGGTGVYAQRLVARGYRVHLIDVVPDHVEQAKKDSARNGFAYSAAVCDARDLKEESGSADVVLLLGPLYHLVERPDRLRALKEAFRVLRPGGLVVGSAISRFRTVLAGLFDGDLHDPFFRPIAERGVRTGLHHNPDPLGHPERFTTAYLHRPDELESEVREAGFGQTGLFGVEGPGWAVEHRWADPQQRENILIAARSVEAESSMIGVSTHFLAVAHKEEDAAH